MRPRSNPPGARCCARPPVAVAVVATAVTARPPAAGVGDCTAPTDSGQDWPRRVHADRATKNAISRAGVLGKATQDPTSAAERRANAAYVAEERSSPTRADHDAPSATARHGRPDDPLRHGQRLLLDGRLSRSVVPGHRPRHLPALRHRPDFLGAPTGVAAEPSENADWTADWTRRPVHVPLADGRWLTTAGGGFAAGDQAPASRSRTTTAARATPRPQINISGAPVAGVSPYQEVRGYVDAHTHGMAFEFLGGGVHCGRPWHEYGAPYALVDCADHTATGGNGAALEAVLSGEPTHDPVGWPTFKDWPAPESLTHEGTYYRWLERSWRGGQRIFVNLLVENNQLCELYPLAPDKHNSCDDMDSVRLQAKDMYELQDYIDAQWGGPGKGFYRIVTQPVGGPPGDQRRQDGRRHGHRDQRALRLHVQASPVATARVRPRLHRHPARRGAPHGRAPDGAGQQVRQRARRRGRRQRRGRRRRQHRQLPGDQLVLGHAALRARAPRRPRQEPARRARHQRRAAGRPVRRGRRALRRDLPPCRSTAARPLQRARPDHARRAHSSPASPIGTCSSTPTT